MLKVAVHYPPYAQVIGQLLPCGVLNGEQIQELVRLDVIYIVSEAVSKSNPALAMLHRSGARSVLVRHWLSFNDGSYTVFPILPKKVFDSNPYELPIYGSTRWGFNQCQL